MLAKHLIQPQPDTLLPLTRGAIVRRLVLEFKDRGHGCALGEFAMPGFGRKTQIFDRRQRLF